jgi:hypothetical protein
MKHAKKITLALFFALSEIASHGVLAETLDFEPFVDGQLLESYGGYQWDNMYIVDPTADVRYIGTGYEYGVTSGTHAGFSGTGNPTSISADHTFDLIGGYFTGALRNGLNLHVTATGTNNYEADFLLNATGPTHIVFNWTGISSVIFTPSGGTHAGSPDGDGPIFVVDDLTLTPTTAVPEPETYAMMMAGLGLVGAMSRRRKRT